MDFYTNQAEAMRIDSSGNVGIGVTPEAWASGQTALQVGAFGSILSATATSAGGSTELRHNAYYDGNHKYQITDEASRYKQFNGTHVFDVAAAGSADATITFSNALTLANNGNATFGGNVGLATQSGTGFAQVHGKTDNKITLADDATTTITSSPCMMLMIYVHTGNYVGAGGIWGLTYRGSTGLVYDDGNCANADTDGKLCVYKTTNSHTTTIKNRLGESASFTIMSYSS
jgi:hypothetical protein